MIRNLTITESDYRNFAFATLLKSLSVVDILLRILQDFRNHFLKEHLRKTATAAFLPINIRGFDLKPPFRFV